LTPNYSIEVSKTSTVNGQFFGLLEKSPRGREGPAPASVFGGQIEVYTLFNPPQKNSRTGAVSRVSETLLDRVFGSQILRESDPLYPATGPQNVADG
jgi:hypothetical protein